MKATVIAYETMRERVFTHAEAHARRSSDPEGFMECFRASMASLHKSVGELQEPPAAVEETLHSSDPVALAAEIEAQAALRMALTYHHTGHCRCAPCKIKKQQAATRG